MTRAALAWRDAGFSVIRVRTDGTKAPLGEWEKYQSEAADESQIREWFADNHPGLGIVYGTVSGNAEMLEFEGRAVQRPGFVQAFGDACTAAGIGDVWARLLGGLVVESPSGGWHLIFRVNGTPVLGNTKLASTPAPTAENPRRTLPLIETRGEGGQAVAPPSGGPVHPTGQHWRALSGSVAAVPVLSADEYRALHDVARSLDETPRPAPVDWHPPKTVDGELAPGEEFNIRATWDEILSPHGWTLVYTRGHKEFWRRPGKRVAVSAVAGGDEGDYFTNFSSSVDLPHEIAMSKWRLYTFLNHSGDFAAAAAELRRQGYGTDRPLPERPPLPALTGDLAAGALARFEEARAERAQAAAAPPMLAGAASDTRDGQNGAQRGAELNLPAWFWESRPVLRHVRDAAWSRAASPDAVLGVCLALEGAYADPVSRVDLGFGPAPLSIFAIAYGPPGAGKNVAMAVGKEILPPPTRLSLDDKFEALPIGSGEGMAEAYFDAVPVRDPATGKVKGRERQQARWNILFETDEGESLRCSQ